MAALLRGVARMDAVEAPPADRLEAGARLAHFEILSELGRGGMGIVYLAEDVKLRRRVALKVLPAAVARDEERRRRLLREARAAAAVSHPNIAAVYDVGEAEGRVYVAMERVTGESVRAHMAGALLGVGDAVEIVLQVLRGLAAAHAAGLVHRDLKPDNVMIAADGMVKVLDFGLAKRTDESAPTGGDTTSLLTSNGQLLGTPAYMSPEQIAAGTVDARSDLFSVGVMLYEMLVGHRPFTGPSTGALLAAVLSREPAPPVGARPEVGAALSQVVLRCLAKDPGARPADARSLAAELATAAPPDTQTAIEPAAARMSAPVASRTWRAARVVAAGLALAVLGAGGWLVWRREAAGGTDQESPGSTSTASASGAATGAPDAAPKPTAVTELPIPPSRSEEARTAYAAATRAIRDANGQAFEDQLRRAVQLDPEMAAAHLRLALIHVLYFGGDRSAAREPWSRAVSLRGTLSERDRLYLDALEPFVARQPPDRMETGRRLESLTQRFPADAELFDTLGFILAGWDDERSLGAFRRSIEIDPDFANSWQAIGYLHAASGRDEEALSALDRCLAVAPGSPDCLGERANFLGDRGRCAEMDATIRNALAANSGIMPNWHNLRVAALVALGRPEEVIEQVLQAKWTMVPDARRRFAELRDRAYVALLSGDFLRVEPLAKEGQAAAAGSADAVTYLELAALRMDAALQTGRRDDAARVAAGYVRKSETWIEGDRGYPIWALRAMREGGLISAGQFEQRRQDELARLRRNGAPEWHVWTVGYGDLMFNWPGDAAEAVAKLPSVFEPPLGATIARMGAGIAALHTGDPARAAALLVPVLRGCWLWQQVLPELTAQLALGQALEQTGDKPGACAAYDKALHRWGNAKPKSVTGDDARARSKALGCPAAPPK
ncbi:MAG: protein kinase [Polyangiaceae bacterium]